MGMIRKNGWFGLFCASALALVGPACNGGSDGEDDMGSGGSDDGSGGKVGTGGKGSSDGGSSSGGQAATGGKPGSDGGSSSGGSEATTGGDTSTGGKAPSGGSPGSGGMGGVSSGGTASDGGSAGEMGFGGEGGAPPEPWVCGGCLKLFVPLRTSGTGTNFQVGLSADTDMTDEVISYEIKVESEGSGGFYQFYATNPVNYASYYSGWTPISTASDFIEATFDLSSLTDPIEFFGQDFYKSKVRWFGIDITGGNSADNTLGDTTMYVDSITFADGTVEDFDFATSVSGFSINTGNSPLAGSTVEWVE